jgi:hypothetical protein
MKIIAIFSIVLLGLGGCATKEPRVREFQAGKPLLFNVHHLEVIMVNPSSFTTLKGTKKPLKDLEEALRLWSVSTFAPAGMEGTLFVFFEEASVTELPVKGRSVDAFSKDATSRFVAKVAVRLEHMNSQTPIGGRAFAKAEHSITLYDDMPLEERDRRLKQLCQDVIQDLDEQVRAAVDDAMSESLKHK